MKLAPLLLAVAACGGKPSGTGAPAKKPAGQPLIDATARLCAAPTRAHADPDWRGENPADNVAVVGKHAADGITNKRVLAFVDGWKNGTLTVDQMRTQLDALTHEANLSSHCMLLDWFTPPQPQAIDPASE
jgi:hypothetical protein